MASLVSSNVCDLNSLYANGFDYPVSQKTLETFFDGKGFGHEITYTPLEKSNLEADVNALYDQAIKNAHRSEIPQITVSAGAPGAGKTMLMRKLLADWGTGVVYIDPDDVCLNGGMPSTYGKELATSLDQLSKTAFATLEKRQEAEKALRQELYTKWRPASNAAHHTIAGHSIKNRYDIFFGTTASSPHTAGFFQFLKDRGYEITVLHVNAPDDVRWESVQERDKTFVQTTKEDIIEKGHLVPQRIQDTYLKFADEIQFYYRSGVKEAAVLAATWIPGTTSGKPSLRTHDDQCYRKIKKMHDEVVCKKLNRPELLWERIVDEPSSLSYRV